MNRREKAIARLLGKHGPLTAIELWCLSPRRWLFRVIRWNEPALAEMEKRGVIERFHGFYALTEIGRRAYLDE